METAGADLAGARRRAEEAGLAELALEARLAAAVLDLGRGGPQGAGARERLRALEAEAGRRGFGLLARQASVPRG